MSRDTETESLRVALNIPVSSAIVLHGTIRGMIQAELDSRAAAELADPQVKDKSAAGRWLALRRWRKAT